MADRITRSLEASSIEIRIADNGGRTMVGYAAKFNLETVIDNWEGNFRESIAPGAFAKTIDQRRDLIQCIYEHGRDPVFGRKPLGKPRVMREDTTGLWVEVPLSPTSYNDDLLAMLRDGVLRQSFAFTPIREKWDRSRQRGVLPHRILHEVKLFEFGPCPFAAYADTSAGVRSNDPDERAKRRAALIAKEYA